MNVTAPSTEPPQQLPEETSSTVTSSTEDNAKPGRVSSAGSSDSVAARFKRHQVTSSPSLRFAAAGSFVAVAILVAAFATTDPGAQPLRLSFLLVLGCAALVTLIELLRFVLSKRGIGFEALSFSAVSLIVTGSGIALFGDDGVPSLLTGIAPALAAATLFLARGFVAQARKLSSAHRPLITRSDSERTQGEVKQGASFSLKPASIVPVDGKVVRGSCAVDERVFSPVPLFRIREEGDIVYAGSEVLAGSAEAIALSTEASSCMRQLQDAIEPMINAAADGLRVEDQRAAKGTVLAIMFLAIAAAISWNERSEGYTDSLLAAGTVALFASLCHATEILYALRCSLVHRWFARGMLLASAESPKQLAMISKVVFDPSTIASGSYYSVADLEVLDDRLSRSALCDCLASILGRAENPLLAAAGEYCRHVATKLSVERVLELHEYPGRGICGSIHGIEVSIGDEDFLVERGIMVQPSDGGIADEVNHPLILVAINADVVARFHMSMDQEDLVTEEGASTWSPSVETSLSTGVATQLGGDTLLVRGYESDLVGQMAVHDVKVVSSKDPEIRPATILAFIPELSGLKALIGECKKQAKLIERTRMIIGFAGLLVVTGVFAGVITPLVPLGLLLILATSIKLS